jgi:recombination protein RecA
MARPKNESQDNAAVATPKPTKVQSKAAAFRAVMAKAFKDSDGAEQVTINEDTFKKSLPFISSGSMVIDYLIGGKPNRFGVMPCPGFPRGKIINLYGQESSGKTTLALTVARSVLNAGGSVLYVDWENAIVPSYAKAIGVNVEDVDNFMLTQPSTLEKGISQIWTAVKQGWDLVVIDSVGAAIPQAYLDQGVDEKGEGVRIGLVAQKWSKILPELVRMASQSGTCIIGISQLRSKINTSGYGQTDGTSAQGGSSWKYYSSLRMGLVRVQQEHNEEYSALTHSKEKMVVGSHIEIKLDKNKISSSQGHKAKFYIKHGEGIDDVRSLIEIASHHGVVKKGGAWLNWEGQAGTIKAQGRDDFKNQMFALKGAWQEITSATVAKLGAIESGKEIAPSITPEEESLAEIEKLLNDNPAVEAGVTGEGGMVEEG